MYQISREQVESITSLFGQNVKLSDVPSLLPDAILINDFPSLFIGLDIGNNTGFYTAGDYGFMYKDVIYGEILRKMCDGSSNLNWDYDSTRETFYCGNPYGLKNISLPKAGLINKYAANSTPISQGIYWSNLMFPYGYSIDKISRSTVFRTPSESVKPIFFGNEKIRFNNCFNNIDDNFIILTNSKNLFTNIIRGKSDIGIDTSRLVKETSKKYSYRGRENFYIQYLPDAKISQSKIKQYDNFSIFPYTLIEIAQKIKMPFQYMKQYSSSYHFTKFSFNNFAPTIANIMSGYRHTITPSSVFGIDVSNHSFYCGDSITNLIDMVGYYGVCKLSMNSYYGTITEQIPSYAITEAACSDSVINMANAYTDVPYLINAACGNNVVNMYRAYRQCSYLKSAVCGPAVENMTETYASCNNLENIKDIRFSSNIICTRGTFYGCSKLNDNLIIPKTTKDASWMYAYCGNDFDISDIQLYPYKENARVNFSGCNIILEPGCEVTNLSYAFYGAKVKIGYIDFANEGQNVINMSYAFAGVRSGYNEQKNDNQSYLYLARFPDGRDGSPPFKWLFPQNVKDMSYAYAYCCGDYIHPSISTGYSGVYLYFPVLSDKSRPRWTNYCNNWDCAFSERAIEEYTSVGLCNGGMYGSLFITNHQATAHNISAGAWSAHCIIFCYKDSPLWSNTVGKITWDTGEYSDTDKYKYGHVIDYLFGSFPRYQSLSVRLYKENSSYCFYSPTGGEIFIKDINLFSESDLQYRP